ncbi:oligosaccharide repeat unit polymerase [Pseudoalteromonas xiamenensis]|uniref:oligosaccharide repeat unit polymerase n=1 Tax=Pseudoalteromonas xiamenensis TaxID=882626 RepID=UPI0035EFF263
MSCIFLTLAIKRSINEGLIISPYLIVVLVFFMTLAYPLLSNQNDFSVDYLVLISIVLLSFFIFLVFIPDSKWFSRRLSLTKSRCISDFLVNALSFVYFLIVFNDIVVSTSGFSSLGDFVFRDRVSAYLSGGIAKGSALQLVSLIPSICYYILIGKSLNRGRYLLSFFLVFYLVVYYFLTANTRLPILFPLAAFFSYIMYFKYNNLTKKHGFLILAFSVCFVFLFGFFSNLIRHGIKGLETDVLSGMHQQNVNQFRYPEWVEDLVSKINGDLIPLEYGFNWFVMPLVNIVPRFIWETKPITSTSNILSESVYNIKIGQGDPITTFTIWGEAYWQFHFLGVFLALFLFFMLFFVFSNYVLKYENTEFYVFYVLINWIPFVRAELPVFFVVTHVVAFFIIVQCSRVITYTWRR